MKPAATRFSCRILTTEHELTQAYRLRYRVFAEQCKFEPENDEKLERDKYDRRSLHLGLWERGTDPNSAPCAYMRFILPDDECPPCPTPGQLAYMTCSLPKESFNRITGERKLEVSRICKDMCAPTAAIMQLQASGLVLARRLGFKSVMAVMAPNFARQLAMEGMNIKRVAPLINYHGSRAGYLIPTTQPAYARRQAELMEHARDDVEQNMRRLLFAHPAAA